MAKNPSANHLYVVWQLMHEASQALPPEEVIALLEEFLEAKAGRKQAWAKFQKAIPWTVERLRARGAEVTVEVIAPWRFDTVPKPLVGTGTGGHRYLCLHRLGRGVSPRLAGRDRWGLGTAVSAR